MTIRRNSSLPPNGLRQGFPVDYNFPFLSFIASLPITIPIIHVLITSPQFLLLLDVHRLWVFNPPPPPSAPDSPAPFPFPGPLVEVVGVTLSQSPHHILLFSQENFEPRKRIVLRDIGGLWRSLVLLPCCPGVKGGVANYLVPLTISCTSQRRATLEAGGCDSDSIVLIRSSER